ncbi:MAG: ribosome silencing factor [Clostridia bacterium]|nr:ribosome silencing factor [Clostridia bacterium]
MDEIITTSDVKLKDNPTPLDIAEFIVKILDIKKARDIKLIHVEERTIIADYYVICTGNSKTQISSLAEEVEYRLSCQGVKVLHNEGGRGDTWILSDYGSVILNVFSAETRDYYKLEKLFSEENNVDISALLTAE